MADKKFSDPDTLYAAELNAVFAVREYIGDTFEQLQINVTATSSSSSFSATTYGITMRNKGGNQIYVNFDATATTSGKMLDPGEEWSIYIDGGVTAVHAICDSGDTSDLRIGGFR